MNASLTFDRFNQSNSALDLKYGYYQMPNGTYFNGAFSIAAWFYSREYQIFSRLIDLSFNDSSKIVLPLFSYNISKPFFLIKNDEIINYIVNSNSSFNLFNWTHIAATCDGTNATIYLNGKIAGQDAAGFPSDVVRVSNFIGKSWKSTDALANAIYDEIRFYNRELSQADVQTLMSLDL